MSVSQIVQKSSKTLFSFEVLPPLRGKGIDSVYNTVEPLIQYNPSFITITSHREQYDVQNNKIRRRPGTVAIAAALKYQYDIPVVPHILCGGFTRSETEYVLIDLNFLGIHDVLALRGDGLKSQKEYVPEPHGNAYAVDLLQQIIDMNHGKYLGDTEKLQSHPTNFITGVAGYPEKHYSAPNLDADIQFLKQKQDAGAEYVITQMFFDNEVYYSFVEKCRAAGVTIPIIPGIKPIGFLSQIQVLPEIFHTKFPEELVRELHTCKTNEDAKKVGTEWAIYQAKDLVKHNVPSLHLFTYSSPQQSIEIVEAAL
ncbi:MAG: methylenetetrahydrofolate reductase [Bacteroidales bacterium]|jgi:methylenetetrahydrofolate reductase (NADPH)|nr:methylenetetrahydrofolate reductase [Bacteroidales bacterium]